MLAAIFPRLTYLFKSVCTILGPCFYKVHAASEVRQSEGYTDVRSENSQLVQIKCHSLNTET